MTVTLLVLLFAVRFTSLVLISVDRWYVYYAHVRAYCSLLTNEFFTEGLRAYNVEAIEKIKSFYLVVF